MKILISTDNFSNSYVYSIDLARSLQKNGIEVFLAVSGTSLTKQQKEELEPFDYSFAEYEPNWMQNPSDDIHEAGQWLLKVHSMVKPELVHQNSIFSEPLMVDVPVITTMHSCELSRWKALRKKIPRTNKENYRQVVKKALEAADVVVAPSYSMLSNAESMYGPFKKSSVIPYGRDSYSFHTDVKEKYIFCEGQLRDESKNLEFIIDAAPEIDYPIYIAGNNEDIQKEKLPENVIFTGALDHKQKSDLLANAFIYLLPAKYDPCGYSFIDAAFSKCALIGGNIPSLRETWGDAMIYIRSKEELIYEISDLMENIEELYLLGQKAFERAHENFRLEKMTRKYYQLYRRVLEYESA